MGERLRYSLWVQSMKSPVVRDRLRRYAPAAVRVTLMFALMLGWTASVLADTIHPVRPGETLYGVARKHGVSVAALAERNGLKSNTRLLVGTRLTIPPKRSNVRPPQPELPSTIQNAISSTPVRSGRWKHIVLHHSGTSVGSAKGMHEYHLRVRHMENGLAYHFVIGNGRGMGDGEIYVGNRWKKQINGGHLASELQNQSSLGICLVGNFDQKAPTARQLTSLTTLIKALQKRCNLGDKAVLTHQQINTVHTRCPGTKFPMKTVLARLRH